MSLKEDLLEAARCCRCEHSVCSDYSPETSHSDTCWHCGHGSGCHDAGRQALIARLRLHASSVEERERAQAVKDAHHDARTKEWAELGVEAVDLRSRAATAERELASLRVRLGEAVKALTEIAEYDPNWRTGAADNIHALQTVAERALRTLETP